MIDPAVIKERITISDVIGQSVKLRPNGSGRWTGLCPFHQEKTPSFSVSDTHGTFRCFGCSEHGDVVDFIQKHDGVDFKEAIREAKVIAGIVDEYLTPDQRRLYELKIKQAAAERKRFKAWVAEVRENLLLYIGVEWSIYRLAKRQLLKTHTDEMEMQAQIAYDEAVKKEAALDLMEGMPDADLLGFFRTLKTWIGVAQPAWYLSGKKLEIAKKAKNGVV